MPEQKPTDMPEQDNERVPETEALQCSEGDRIPLNEDCQAEVLAIIEEQRKLSELHTMCQERGADNKQKIWERIYADLPHLRDYNLTVNAEEGYIEVTSGSHNIDDVRELAEQLGINLEDL